MQRLVISSVIILTAPTSTWKQRLLQWQRTTGKFIFKWLGRWNTRLQPRELFSIKPGYHHALQTISFENTVSDGEGLPEVYRLAIELAQELNATTVICVGCGPKGIFFNTSNQFTLTSIEQDPGYTRLKQEYPDQQWLLFEATNPATLQADLVICSGMAEHFENPDDLMDFLVEIKFRKLIISTREREAVAGKNDYGPPDDITCYREWNTFEFKSYLWKWFRVEKQHISKHQSSTQVVICQKK